MKRINQGLTTILLLVIIGSIYHFSNPKNAREWHDRFWNTEVDILQEQNRAKELELKNKQMDGVLANKKRFGDTW